MLMLATKYFFGKKNNLMSLSGGPEEMTLLKSLTWQPEQARLPFKGRGGSLGASPLDWHWNGPLRARAPEGLTSLLIP